MPRAESPIKITRMALDFPVAWTLMILNPEVRRQFAA
jgi:hypothetical protein